MERGDFISGEAWCKYKFERESKNEEIARLQIRAKRAKKDFHNLLVFDRIALVVMLLLIIAETVGWI